MNQTRCVCPNCGTTLRVKDRAYLNRPVPCPDCRSLLVLSTTADDRLEVRLVEAPAAASSPPSTEAKIRLADEPTWFSRLASFATNVTVVSWIATLLVAGMIGFALVRPKHASRTPSPNPLAVSPAGSPAAAEQPPSHDDMRPAVVEPEPVPIPDRGEDMVAAAEQPIEALVEPEPQAPAAIAEVALPDAPPPAVVPPPPPPVDWASRLKQPLKSFRQDRGIPRRDLLELVEEMLGAPIRYDEQEIGDQLPMLDQKLSLDLENITVGELLAKILDQTLLEYDLDRDELRLRIKDDPAREAVDILK